MKVKDLSREELRTLVKDAVEDALVGLFGDPDYGLELRPEVIDRLQHSLKQVKGEERIPAEEVAKRVGVNW